MRYAVVTGVSKGLGESIAKLLMASGVNVIGVSRTENDKLAEAAAANNVAYRHFRCDLGDQEAAERIFRDISEDLFAQKPDTVHLVHNAAVLEPVDQSMHTNGADVAHHIQVNTIIPMVLTNLFLAKAAEHDVRFIGTSITSGAARRPVYGWSAYCTSKAGIDMFTKTAALEQDELKTPSKVIAFSPGIMDTEMQEKIRRSDRDAFMEVDQFRQYKENSQLQDTDTVGSILVDILTDESSIVNGKIYDVSEFL